MASLQVVDSADDWAKPPQVGVESGSAFGWDDRLFAGFENGKVFDYGEIRAQDMSAMMDAEYKARQVEAVLTLPVLSATYHLKPAPGDNGQAKWLEEYWQAPASAGGCQTSLDEVISRCTTAFTYRRAYFELVYKPSDKGKNVVYDKVAYRPATTCRLARDARNGAFAGFQQEAYGPIMTADTQRWPINIPTNRAFVYIHGQRLNPMQGSSDLDITYWAWRTKQKLLFLWFQYLENLALPRTIVKADDIGTANDIARKVAALKGSGVLPVSTTGNPGGVSIDTLDVSGKGADQFMAVIRWLDQAATGSVLAGFLNLADAAANGAGSYALSKDASDFFLQARQADVRELATSLRRDLFGPLIGYNFGPKAPVPIIEFEPLSAEDKSDLVTMLTALLSNRTPDAVPNEFIGELAAEVATYLGMDGDKVRSGFDAVAKRLEAQADAKLQMATQMPAQMTPKGQEVAGHARELASGTGSAITAATGRAPTGAAGAAAAAATARDGLSGGAARSGDPAGGVPGKQGGRSHRRRAGHGAPPHIPTA